LKSIDFVELLVKRRATRSLQAFRVTKSQIHKLAAAARLAPSCFNNQPWRYIFTYDPDLLNKLYTALSKGNDWARKASLIICVMSKKELDCIVAGREYYLFDTGLATANLILQATELGLVAHPIAGFSESQVKEALNIPDNFTVITLIIVGQKPNQVNPELNEKQLKSELQRPTRLSHNQFIFLNKYCSEH
jgi:nitroreductase